MVASCKRTCLLARVQRKVTVDRPEKEGGTERSRTSDEEVGGCVGQVAGDGGGGGVERAGVGADDKRGRPPEEE